MQRLAEFFHVAMKLKTLKRAGWERCGVGGGESVAEHSFAVATLALMLPPTADLKLDRGRCVALALVHDLAEAIVGDLTPHDRIDPAEKSKRERQAVNHLSQLSKNDELRQLWEEFEAAQTAEARLVRELDVIEMAWQAREYQRGGKLSEAQASDFVTSAQRRVQSDVGKRLLDAMTGRRA